MKATARPRRLPLRQMAVNAVFAALLCALSPLAIPIGPIPVTLGLLVVLLCGTALAPQNSVQAVAVYLALGACGLPVFSGGAGGLQVFFGPTGGYLWSYLLIAPTVGLLRLACPRRLREGEGRGARAGTFVWEYMACVAGILLCYLGGTAQFCALTGQSVGSALCVCVLPFLPFDLFKCLAAAVVGRRVRKFVV